MAHSAQQQFMESIRDRFPESFKDVRVLDIGSLDINGNNRGLFTNAQYVGLDIGEGPNVDVVSRGHEYKDEIPFDFIVSSECFEHDEYWVLTFSNGYNLLRSGGMFMFSCAAPGRPEHGTKRTSPRDSPFTSELENDYYRNLSEEDFREFPLDEWFSEYEFKTNNDPCDLYFWGIKK